MKFLDFEFRANDTSIWGNQEIDENVDIIIQWKRISDIYNRNESLVYQQNTTETVKAGILADYRIIGAFQQINSR